MINLNKSSLFLFIFVLIFSLTVKGEPKVMESDQKTTSTNIENLKITILYDNYIHKEGTKSDWGFACLIEGLEKTILFDTGTRGDILYHNISQMIVNINKVDQVVISHHHRDHFGGLQSVLEKNHTVTVHLLQSTPVSVQQQVKETGANVKLVDTSIEICKNVFLTGELGEQIKEQALILKTNKGLIVLTGCSHPGIVKIVKRVKEILKQEIYLVFGGFHLMRHSEREVNLIIKQLKAIGVQKCGATHCTGDIQIAIFKEAFGTNFVQMGTGKVITFLK